ncbi:unnamed protein product [Protopolystoma xenopodis]|uniref:Uncharacterized protein n=1 Tax=Protopolystoma xenopodis TaxID=117903 RepID=A0A3S5CUU3_9PLAT|nr:unnamed protein product [Protopolystoma xenopodis]
MKNAFKIFPTVCFAALECILWSQTLLAGIILFCLLLASSEAIKNRVKCSAGCWEVGIQCRSACPKGRANCGKACQEAVANCIELKCEVPERVDTVEDHLRYGK